jgi:hypothetical protein
MFDSRNNYNMMFYFCCFSGESYREMVNQSAPLPTQIDMGSPAFKKIRLGVDTNKPPVILDSVQQPLRVDTGVS